MATAAGLALGCFSKLLWPMRIILIYAALMIMIGVAHSASRGSWLALAVAVWALVIWGLRHGTLRWWIPVMAPLALFGFAVALFSMSSVARERAGDLVTLFEGAISAPTSASSWPAMRFTSRTIIPSSAPGPDLPVRPSPLPGCHLRVQGALTHDDYLNCLDDYGIIGFALAMFFVAAVTLKFFRPLDLDARWQDRVIVATGFAAWWRCSSTPLSISTSIFRPTRGCFSR